MKVFKHYHQQLITGVILLKFLQFLQMILTYNITNLPTVSIWLLLVIGNLFQEQRA